MNPNAVHTLQSLVRSRNVRRILCLSTGDGSTAIRLAQVLPADGVLFTFEADPGLAAAARERVAEARVPASVHIMIGAPDRLVHKVAGPFDLIVSDGVTPMSGSALDRIHALLGPDGVLISSSVPAGDDRWEMAGALREEDATMYFAKKSTIRP